MAKTKSSARQREALKSRILEMSLLRGCFRLSSGGTSDVYLDHFQLTANPDVFQSIINMISRIVPADTDVIAGVALGGIVFAAPLALTLSLPAAFVRKARKTYGTCRQIEGASVKGKSVCIIDDIISTGQSLASCGSLLKAEDASRLSAVCLVNRANGPLPVLQAAGIELHALFDLEELIPQS
jgi:orotate phosphoribosyltransferase